MLKLLQYHLLETLSENITTIVYRALKQPENTPVILKTLISDHPQATDIARLRYEYNLVCQLNLPGIAQPQTLENWQGRPLLVIEDFGGRDLSYWQDQQLFDLEQLLSIGQKIAIALGQLHQEHIIHKDIKPKNIVYNPDTNQLKLIDFSISSRLSKENPQLTSPNVLQGSLAYMSPEQTGRMNRVIDYRCDFYALGVSLYELLTGQLPFDCQDPMELVHCHIAKPPIPPHQINPEIPEVVSAIVLKLMAKTAEERYQSSQGINADLETCRQQWLSTKSVTVFPLGQQDQQGRFSIPEKLYGRDAEVEQLLHAFERISYGPSEIMLVAGYSGIGKSALVKEIYKPIVHKRGYFISGKFDQFQRNVPYSCLIQAFRELIRQLLTETEAELVEWRNKLQLALGKNGKVISDVIPEIELIIGAQPPISSLTISEAQNRFNLVFQTFIQVFTQPDHPLVIFLDDLQWADPASLQLIQLLVTDPDSENLLMLGAYRDNEVSRSHPLMTTLAKIKQEKLEVTTLTLGALSLDNISELIQDTLKQTDSTVEPLAKLLLDKTKGNPFFVRQTLKYLHSENLLHYDSQTGSWQWNPEQLLSISITENVVELMTREIQRLDHSSQFVLQLAACIGNKFDINILAIVNKKSPARTAADLRGAIQAGLVIPLDQNHDLSEDIEEIADIKIVYKFLHDRVQQAAYSLIPPEHKQEVHVRVGQRLLEQTDADTLDERLFDIVNALNIGASLIDAESERLQLAELNLNAALKAKASAAYSSALDYLKQARQCLPEMDWDNHYDLTLTIYTELIEVYYIQAQFTEAQQMSDRVFRHAKTLLDKIKIYEFKIQFLIAQNQMLDAINTALVALELLGYPLEIKPETLTLVRPLPQLEELPDYPEMTDPQKLAVLKILTIVSGPAYQAQPELLPYITAHGRNLSLQFGHSSLAAYSYGMIETAFPDIEMTYYTGIISLKVLQQYPSDALKCKVYMLFNSFIRHWKEPHQQTIPALDETISIGMETGDVVYAAYCAMWSCGYMVVIGLPLADVAEQQQTYLDLLATIKQNHGLYPAKTWRQFVQNLQGDISTALTLDGDYFKASDRAILEMSGNRMLLFFVYFAEALLGYLFKDWAFVQEKMPFASDYKDAAFSSLLFCYYYFYETLMNCAIYPQLSAEAQIITWETIQERTARLEQWREAAPDNYQSKCELIAAEQARIQGQILEAMDYYDRAITSAQTHGFLVEVAIATERAADFYNSLGRQKIANHYLQDAYYAYEHWGATAKMAALLDEHPQLSRIVMQQRMSSSLLSGKITISQSNSTSNITVNQTSSRYSTHSNDILDLGTVIKATQALSSQIRLPELLQQLLTLALENAGAQRGYLLLMEESHLAIAASGQVESNIGVTVESESHPINNQTIPVSLIHYVQRTQESVVLPQAIEEGLFTQDPYIQRERIQSILCLPILQQGQILGILYLENNLTQGAFTRDRLEVLQVLSAQAAISIENARLYRQLTESNHHLEDIVGQRTQELQQKNQDLQQTLQELQQTQTQLIQTEKMSSLGQLVAGIAHEINNPVTFIAGNISYAREYFKDLRDLIDLIQDEYQPLAPSIQDKIDDIELDFLYEDLRQMLVSMEKGSDRIRRIILSLRNFSRLDESVRKTADIHEGLDNTLLIIQHRLNRSPRQDPITIKKNYGELPEIACYPSQLNQVFLNILNNAIDVLLSSESQANPEIQIKTNLTNTNTISIRILDNGSGMSEAVRQKIFDPFFTTKSVGQGTGLGLSISYQIITEQHGGQLTCYSQPGEGSEFIIEIPVNRS